ncbi:stage III sporulation protein AE [Thermosyntropha lipolytica DSM 11003]|uniref:Stage III sporulation protein AE n=1 Tax=Thermosyntropha lipolytica DSM 11003 TaxID=1123382 RepID=A0A1M5LJN5_9FIRM|nr:stage III sporulation protein AE [Thermosyntropha lipolytica]SHG65247.1 stage III sporulation protein AE [Thermosyntropha lipolytica DSM 11003]
MLGEYAGLLKKAVFIWILLCIIFLSPDRNACASEADIEVFSVSQAVESLDFTVLEEYKKKIDGEINSYLENKTVKDWVIAFIKGEWKFDYKELINSITGYLFKEIKANTGLLGKLLLLAVLSALLINLQTSFASGIGQIAYMACFLALCAIALGSFKLVLDIGLTTVNNMVSFMVGLLPQMAVLVAGLGNINTSVMIFPLVMGATSFFANAIKNIVFPLIIMSALLHLINNMTDSLKVARMAKFFTQVAQLALGLFLTVFVGIFTLKALYASVLDKVTLRTTKFITDNAIPVVGKMFSDTLEVAAGYIVLLKQAVTVYGVLIILGIVLFPVLKIAVIALIYKIASALAEPLGDGRTATILEIMSAHLFLMMSAVAAVSLMFLIMIVIVASLSNYAMVR